MTAYLDFVRRPEVKTGPFCWEWIGAKEQFGYGVVSRRVSRVNGGKYLAHRICWELRFGPIAPGLCVLHRCDNPACINPAHLFLGTRLDNMRDMIAKGRAKHDVTPRGEAHGMAKLTADQVCVIRERCARGESQRLVGKDFGVTQTLVSRIARGTLWAHVPTED